MFSWQGVMLYREGNTIVSCALHENVRTQAGIGMGPRGTQRHDWSKRVVRRWRKERVREGERAHRHLHVANDLYCLAY